MSTTVNVNNNNGIISTGKKSNNVIYQQPIHINWERLNQEISDLKSNPDGSIQKFANEATEVVEKKDERGIRTILSKWIPCISDLISSSYYILEIAKTFNILQ